MDKKTALLPMQKLHALANKHYSGQVWEPKKGDYYTSSRVDLELYQILEEDDNHFYTVYCHVEECKQEPWVKEKFLEDFGVNRVHVPEWIFEHIKD